MALGTADRRLLSLLQTEFPITGQPFARLGRTIGVDAEEVIRQIASLKAEGIIRSIGPVVDGRKLGYHSTLVAMKVPEAGLDLAESVISAHPGVSHGYERQHCFNVWFTLALSPAANVERELGRLTAFTRAEAAVSLPAVKLFKIGAFFDVDETAQRHSASGSGTSLAGRAELTETERLVLNELQQDLPLMAEPFVPLAERTGLDLEDFLTACRSLLQSGVIRRFSASINHRRAGFTANAMVAWVAPADRVDALGNRLAALKEVSHCYERKTGELWHHNVFAMVHGHSKEACQEIAEAVSRETGLTDCQLLYSTKEFKKARIKYLA